MTGVPPTRIRGRALNCFVQEVEWVTVDFGAENAMRSASSAVASLGSGGGDVDVVGCCVVFINVMWS